MGYKYVILKPLPGYPPLSDTEVLELAQECIKFREVIPQYHSSSRMGDRNFNILDIVLVIKTGEISRKPVWNNEHQNYRYYIKGKAFDGCDLEVVIAFTDQKQLIIVTGLG